MLHWKSLAGLTVLAAAIAVLVCSRAGTDPSSATSKRGAGAAEFRWNDAQGMGHATRDAEQIPLSEWNLVTSTVHPIAATSGERFLTSEGIAVVIEGIQAPVVQDDGTVITALGEAARARLEKMVVGSTVTLEFEGDRQLPDGDWLAHVATADGRQIAELLLAEGAVRLLVEDGITRHLAANRAAQAAARKGKLGVWSRPAAPAAPLRPFFRGVSLGLFAQNDDFDYAPFTGEMQAFGAGDLLIATPHLMEDWESVDFGPVPGRSASWSTVQRTVRAARQHGLTVSFLPLVLLRTGNFEHWRGDIKPKKPWVWFRNYARYLGNWADLSTDLGASLLSVGTEYSSMESATSSWRAVIATIKSRFDGQLTYSANWDHITTIRFWDELDLAGMTGYHTLTNKNDPTVEELTAGWVPIRTELMRLQKQIGKPIFFTEIGYSSLDGANSNPWDYTITTPVDLKEQADCFAAYIQAWKDVGPEFRGMFLWNWWRGTGDPKEDRSYSIFGKPAYEIMSAYYKGLESREKR